MLGRIILKNKMSALNGLMLIVADTAKQLRGWSLETIGSF